MNWGFRNVLVNNKPLIDDGSAIYPASVGIPMEPGNPNRLEPHYGGKHFVHDRAPEDYRGFDVQLRGHADLYPHDTMSFGGYHGGNFLERDTQKSLWKQQ